MRLATLVGITSLLVPAVARACPVCAGREDGGVGQLVALGLFVTFPFAIAAIVARIVRRGDSSAGDALSTSPRKEASP